MQNLVSFRSGGRVGWLNATWPFATLSVGLEKLVIKKEEPRRTINPEDLNISKGNVINRLFTGLTGSTFLAILCIGITVILFILFIWTL